MHAMNKLLLTALLLLHTAIAAPAASVVQPLRSVQTTQDHEQIKNLVADFVQQQTAKLPGKSTYQVEDIDRRLVLPKCDRLEAFLPTGSRLIGKTTIGVRCTPSAVDDKTNERSNPTWNIFIPVQIKLNLNLLISTQQLPLGHALQEQDIASQAIDSSQPGGYTDPNQVIGKVLRYGISAGQVLREDMLRQPYSVTQGQIVQLAMQGSGFSIRSEGVALNNAAEGQAVQVRVASGRVISGTARNGGIVQIAP